MIFRLLCCRVAIQRRYEGPWSILDEPIWSLTSQRSKRISSSRKFRSSPQKDFFNTIGLEADCQRGSFVIQRIFEAGHNGRTSGMGARIALEPGRPPGASITSGKRSAQSLPLRVKKRTGEPVRRQPIAVVNNHPERAGRRSGYLRRQARFDETRGTLQGCRRIERWPRGL